MMRLPGFTHFSIRSKLIVIVAGTLILAQAISVVLIRDVVSHQIMQQSLTTVDILTTSILHDVTYESQRNPQSDGQQIIAKYMTYYRIIGSMSLYDGQLERTASSDPELVGKRSEDREIVAAVERAKPSLHVSRPDFRNLGIRSVAPIMQGSHVVGALSIDVSMRDVQATLNALDQRIGLIMTVMLAVVCLALFVLLRGSILLRLRGLMDVTTQIAAGNYDARVGDSQRDEIGQLARAFDQMTSDLQRSKREIEDYNKNLEQRVHEATGRLQQAYQELQSAQTQLVANEKMATLGVLVAGVAHEINTPTGAILNVSRNLERHIEALPDHLASFKRDPDSPVDAMVDCLRAMIASSRRSQPSASLKVQKAVEATLREHGVPDVSPRAASLCKLNFTDPQEITRYIECFRVASFFSFAETFASIAQAAHISETSARKIAEIIRALKYYAYADTERVEMLQVNDSIATALVLLDNHLKHKVAVRADYDPELPRIPCTSELHQVWTNLLTNASDAIGECRGDSPGEIRIATRRDGEAVVVSISDNGPGIPAEARERIFDPFFTTKDVGKGTGLGLCIVSGIVKKHHGTIRLDSVPGRTTFEVVVPLTGHHGNGSPPAPDAAVPPAAPGDERQAA